MRDRVRVKSCVRPDAGPYSNSKSCQQLLTVTSMLVFTNLPFFNKNPRIILSQINGIKRSLNLAATQTWLFLWLINKLYTCINLHYGVCSSYKSSISNRFLRNFGYIRFRTTVKLLASKKKIQILFTFLIICHSLYFTHTHTRIFKFSYTIFFFSVAFLKICLGNIFISI